VLSPTQLQEGTLEPTKVLAHPSMMSIVNPLARVLGPKGLFPSAKRGTVTTDLAKAIMEAKGGLDWKAESDGVVRSCTFASLVLFCPHASYSGIGRVCP
jgi:large subunit ribosomal protein L1